MSTESKSVIPEPPTPAKNRPNANGHTESTAPLESNVRMRRTQWGLNPRAFGIRLRACVLLTILRIQRRIKHMTPGESFDCRIYRSRSRTRICRSVGSTSSEKLTPWKGVKGARTTGSATQKPRLYDTNSRGAEEGECSEDAIWFWVVSRTDLSAPARKTPT